MVFHFWIFLNYDFGWSAVFCFMSDLFSVISIYCIVPEKFFGINSEFNITKGTYNFVLGREGGFFFTDYQKRECIIFFSF